MRIRLINPSLAGEYFRLITEKALKLLPLDPQTRVEFVSLREGPNSISSIYDEALAIAPLLKEIRQAEESGCDAVVIHCFGDPGLHAARELVSIPVIGPGETSILFAMMLGKKATIMPTSQAFASRIRQKIRELGLDSELFTIRSIEVSVLDSDSEKENTKKKILREAKKATEEDAAEVVILGCTGWSGLAKELSGELGVPVIDPLFVALKIAELQVNLKLSHSKIAYPHPRKEKMMSGIR
jgi:allantoin racemase